MLSNLSVGVDDWQRPEMLANYYPESLPQDWRADFYFNDYSAVLVSQADWTEWDQAVLAELEQAYHEHTVIYLRIDDQKKIDMLRLESLCGQLGDWIAGFVVFDPNWPEQQAQMFGRPVSYVSNNQAWSGWHWCYQGWFVSGAPCGWVVHLPDDAKQQREMLQSFVESLPDKKTAVPFFVGGESINMGRLQSLKTLAELLGY